MPPTGRRLDEEDRALGCSGAVVPIAQPQQLADAALALLADTATWNAASQAGIARVGATTPTPMMFDRYRRSMKTPGRPQPLDPPMAGMGFELRHMLRKTPSGLVQAYAYAGVIGSGPWVLSIVGIPSSASPAPVVVGSPPTW